MPLASCWLVLAGLLMPIGVLLHGLFGVPPLLVFLGGTAMIVATLWLGREALSLRSSASAGRGGA